MPHSKVGSVLQWGTDQRSIVSIRTNPPHQLPGTAGSLTSSENFCQREVRDNNINSPENRQDNSCCLHQQDGRDSITYTVAADKRPVAVVYGKKYSLTSSALTRSIEFHRRQGVEDLVRQIRMETQSWKINLLLGPLSIDLFASRLSTQLSSFVSWKPNPLAMAVDAFTEDWGSIPGLTITAGHRTFSKTLNEFLASCSSGRTTCPLMHTALSHILY